MKLDPVQHLLARRLVSRGMPVERAMEQAKRFPASAPPMVKKASADR